MTPQVAIVDGRPERLFGISEVGVEREGTHAVLPIGSWLRDADGTIGVGALGVLVDDALGYGINVHRPEGAWSVSTDIAIHLLAQPDPAATALRAQARPVLLDPATGFAVGEVRDDTGVLVASCSQRGRFVPTASLDFVTHETPPAPTTATDLADLLGAQPLSDADGATLSLPIGPDLRNPMGNLHGGVTIAAASVVAARALTGSGLRVDSVDTLFVRPVPGGSTAEFRARVLHRGRRTGVVDVVATVAGRQCILARATAAG